MNPNETSPIRFPPRRDSISSTDSERTGPTGNPRGTSDFRKVLARDNGQPRSYNRSKGVADDDEEDEQVALGDDTAIKPAKKPTSLFDLSSNSKKDLSLDDTNISHANTLDLDEEIPVDYNGDLPIDTLQSKTELSQVADSAQALAKAKGLETANKVDDVPSPIALQKAQARDVGRNLTEEVGEVMTPVTKKENADTRFVSEPQPDLSYVNPFQATLPNTITTNLQPEKPTIPTTHIQDIINQLVDKVQEMKFDGRTDTTVTLRHPPLFAGANIIVTGFDSAKGEFNIAFENLTQAAKAVLDMQMNKESLRTALEEKGYAVHIITATTLVENRPIDVPVAESRSGNRNSRENQDREGRERNPQGRGR